MSTKVRTYTLPQDNQEVLKLLCQHILHTERNLEDFKKRHFNSHQEEAIIYCLDHAIDLSKGCAYSIESNLPDSSATLSRAMLETLFWARYVTLSQENAQEFIDSTNNELKRIARKNINEGYAGVLSQNSHEDKTKEFLDSEFMKDIPRRKSIESIARASELGHVYSMIYGFISLYAHGKTIGFKNESKFQKELYASACAALGALECIDLIAMDWITYRKKTSQEIIQRLLGV